MASLGYRVLSTGNPDTACELLAAGPADAVLLDVHRPTMSGLALYLVIVNRWPALDGRIAIMTADPDAADVRRWLQLNRCPVFRKPFRVDLLAGWLAAALRPTRRRVGEG